MGYFRHIKICNQKDISRFSPFYIDGQRVGWVRTASVKKLRHFPGVFQFDGDAVSLNERLVGVETRTRAVSEVVEALSEDGLIGRVRGEMYRVSANWSSPALMLLDRGAVPFFGIRAYGVHLNGFVGPFRDLKVWVGRRSPEKAVAPGKLDNVVAGGQPAGLSLRENLLKEAAEEAGFGSSLMEYALSVGVISYEMETLRGLRSDTLFLYDLGIPDEVTPRCMDGEMSEFMLWPIDRVLRTVRETDDFKFNVALVMIDFGIRHGLIDPDLEPEYPALIEGLRTLPFG